ncbi:DUF922 domain-containing protein [Ferruginibacter sp. SUN002]|uniref:DUF922 domain-containing protein n=1 Tax=Ferruginibacter sp. SUN002 TaxID=2937789 RepID=UPI003D3688BE
MHKYLIVFLFSFIASLSSIAQVIDIKVSYVPADENDKTVISYVAGNKLSWSDFQGTPDDNMASAITSSGIGYRFTLHQTEDSAWFVFTVDCKFSKTKSWVLKDKKTDYVLRHEQNHFDITYINTLLFIEKLKKADLSVKNYRNEIKAIYKQISEALSKMQRDYDTETKNGMDEQKQVEWNKKIATQLETLQSAVIGSVH